MGGKVKLRVKDRLTNKAIAKLHGWIADRQAYIHDAGEEQELSAFKGEIDRLEGFDRALAELVDYRKGTEAVYFTLQTQRWRRADSEMLTKVVHHSLRKLGVQVGGDKS